MDVKEKKQVATIEDRLKTLEQEHIELKETHTELRKTIELQTIAIGALVNKATLEKLNEKYDKLFDTLIVHDQFTNQQLAEVRDQITEVDGKVVGLQTQMNQQITEVDGKVVGLQTQLRQTEKRIDTRFENIEALLAQIIERLP